jgi:hypothetical protein
MTSHSHVRLHPDLTQAHLPVLQRYLREAYGLSRDDWRALREAMALLASSQVVFQEQTYTFHHFYTTFLEAERAPTFLAALYQLANVSQDGPALQAQNARAILAWLTTNGFYGPDAGEASFLVVYCLYQWASFAGGYVFQITIFRDLEASGIRFTPRDPRLPQERYADHDLMWLGFKGDVKQSLYFLDALPRRALTADFYLTQMYDRGIRRQRRVVMMHERLWRHINGEATPGQLPDALQGFPDPVAIDLQQEVWVLMDYEVWKAHLLQVQMRGTP